MIKKGKDNKGDFFKADLCGCSKKYYYVTDVKVAMNRAYLDDKTVEFENEDYHILTDVEKDEILKSLENTSMGIPISEFNLPEDWEDNWMDYAQEAIEEEVEDSEEFSTPTNADVQGDSINGLPSATGNRKTINVYKYASSVYGPSNIDKKSRDFCKRTVLKTNNTLLTYREVISLNNDNPGFGKGGSNSYSVIKWRGGTNCKHLWFKFVYNLQDGTFEKASFQPNQPKV